MKVDIAQWYETVEQHDKEKDENFRKYLDKKANPARKAETSSLMAALAKRHEEDEKKKQGIEPEKQVLYMGTHIGPITPDDIKATKERWAKVEARQNMGKKKQLPAFQKMMDDYKQEQEAEFKKWQEEKDRADFEKWQQEKEGLKEAEREKKLTEQ